MRVVAALLFLTLGCIRGAPAPAARPLPPGVLAPPPDRVIVPPEMGPPPADTMISYVVPPFREGPLVAWGPLPPGEAREERRRVYDLQHQVVRIRADWQRRAVIGSTSIRFAALDSTLATASFDAVDMRIVAVKTSTGTPLQHRYDGRTLEVILRPALARRARTTIVVDYETERPRKGFYFVARRHVAWTQGETEDTRYWVPTYDHPNDKTTWEILVTTDRSERALSNGRLVASRAVSGGIEWHWSLGRPASTYLMSVVTGDFTVLQDVWRGVPIGYWTYPDSVEAAWRGFGQTPRMVDVFSRLTGVPYPWEKYDQAVAPDYIFGGMENVTATTQSDDHILHPAWAEPQANAEALVAHELAHQWYGNYVTARHWSDIWLHEGFATFFEAVWAEARDGPDAGAVARLAEQEEAIEADRLARRPLVFDRWVTDPLELFLTGHIYPKGAAVLQMLRHRLGDSLFWNGMNAYTRAHALGVVTTTDFRSAMERAAGRDLGSFFRQWVHGAGFPTFRVSYAYDSVTRTLSMKARQVQERDSLTGLFDADVDVEVLTAGGATRGVMAVRGEEASLSLELPGKPLSIRWDKGGWLLDITDFPRPSAMLAHQLRSDDDVVGRIEAAALLAERVDDPRARLALAAAAREDTDWAVRVRAIASLERVGGDTAAVRTLVDATRDADPRVRARAAAALGMSAGEGVRSRLREVIAADSSPYVRGAALGAYARLGADDAMSTIQRALDRDSWLDIERTRAVAALALVDTRDSWITTKRYLAAGTSRPTRQAAIASLVARATGREAELAADLEPLLGDDDPFVRAAAARALGSLGQQSAVPALESRRAVEAESRVINAILGALAALRPR